MFQMPMSSPMMTTMFGFGCWAAAGAAISAAAANRVTSRSNRLRFWLGIGHFPRLLGLRAHGLVRTDTPERPPDGASRAEGGLVGPSSHRRGRPRRGATGGASKRDQSRFAFSFMAASSFLMSSGDSWGRSTLLLSLLNLAVSGNGGL